VAGPDAAGTAQLLYASTRTEVIVGRDEGRTWQPTSPSGGPAYVIAADPVRAAVVYGGMQGRGIYKSVDCGATWSPINRGLPGGDVPLGGE
jgi:hypothetical protein